MFRILTLKDQQEWISIIDKFRDKDVYYLPSYTKAFEIHGDGQPILIYFEDQLRNLKAANVAMLRDISEIDKFRDIIEPNQYFDLMTPYGYGGFIFEGNFMKDDLNRFNKEYELFCIDNKIVSEFVRVHPLHNNLNKLEKIYELTEHGKTISLSLDSKQEIWDNFTSKNRNIIRKAIKSGVEVYWGRSQALLDEFIPLYKNTMNHDNASDYYYFSDDFYKSIIYDLKYNMMFFYAVKDSTIASIAMILFDNHSMHYHLSASNRMFQKYAPNNLLLSEVAIWGLENGFTNFHLGGGLGGQEDSLFKFKKAFNKSDPNKFYLGKKIFNNIIYEELSNKIQTKSDYFPKYRA
ncbi:GNAT family N-acetyltransferase [Aerococcus sp.]|uniref:GNAT family N-acetyltransferase n=1 Tax=Aerococcus sp. TaxID=1872398 RepID=UPI0028B04E8F|nr:GNAT family N-acetyltransferase [Aerococcus sp.]